MNYKELKQIIQKHNIAYYDDSASMITDAEYDQLYDKLETMEKAQGWRDHDSPTKHVGGSGGKITHPYKLYSLRKVYDIEEVDDFMSVKLPKIDGANLTPRVNSVRAFILMWLERQERMKRSLS